MAGMPNRVFEEALSLPSDERVDLVERLLQSLNLPLQPDIERAWQDEAERRVAQIMRGEVEMIPAEDVYRKIRERYQLT